MSSRDDQQALLKQLRPHSVVDTVWPEPARDAALARILADSSPSAATRPRRRRRLMVIAALSAVLIPTGVGVAAADGLLSASLIDQLAWWNDQSGDSVDVRNARRVAQEPGPDESRMMTVWTAAGPDGTICTAIMFEAPGALDRPADQTPDFGSGSCPTPAQRAQSTFGEVGGGADEQGVHTMMATVGSADRAELQFADGTVRDVLAVGDDFAFWYRADEETPAPELVGYDSTGKEIARRPLPNLGLPLGTPPF